MKEDVLAAVQTRRPAGDHYAFIKTQSRLRNWSRSQIKIDVVGDEQIEFAVAIVVDKRAASVPTLAVPAHPGFVGHISERAIAVIVVKHVLAKIGDEEIFEAVVVVVTNADALSPAGVGYASLQSNVGECAVSIILEKMRRRLLAPGETFQVRSIHKKNIQPAIVIVIVKSHAAARGLKQSFVLVLAAVDCFGIQSRLAVNIDKSYAEIGGFGRGGRLQ